MKDEINFNISQVAKLIGVSAATIRNWEKNNLITIKRANNGYRTFSLQDIESLRKIHTISKQRLSTETMQASNYPSMLKKKTAVPIIAKSLLGNKWKNKRLSLGLTTEQLANKTGISSSYIHKIENAQANNVSFEILQKLASFYGENILSYYDEYSTNSSPMVKKGTADPVDINLEGVSLYSLTRAPFNRLTGMIYKIAPGCGRLEASFHNGEEIVYILGGSLDFYLEEKCYPLTEGDSLHFKSHVRHKWINTGHHMATVFWVHSSAAPKV